MYTLNVNGQNHVCEKDQKLMRFLRDELGLNSVKDGCAEGACGTCTIVIDGKAQRACVPTVAKTVGKTILTCEGLSEREKDVFAYAFGKAGAVQCGFCIPGMVMCAKALLDKSPDPTPEEVKMAIRTNICRCTGYIKIEEAILLAARLLREGTEVCLTEGMARIGERFMRVDATAKTLGTAMYVDDYVFDGMLYGKSLFTQYARAKILSIDTTAAKQMPGIVAIYTAEDIPGERYIGHLAHDWPGMIAVGEETKMIGDSLAIVVGETREQTEAAVKAVQVEYEVLKAITSPEEAMQPDAAQIHGEGFKQFGKFRIPKNNVFDHQEVKRGAALKMLDQCAFVSEREYDLPFTEHAFMETETAIGIPDGDGIKVITSGQGIYDEYHELALYLGIPQEKVRIQSAIVGGGFGGKEDMSVQHQAALCAYLCQRPVKVYFSRQESINYHPKRHAMKIKVKLGCDENGIFKALWARLISDTGAYASLGGPVLQRACTHIGGPYNYQDIDVEGDAYYTNNPPAGAFRGFGVTQSAATVEPCINDLAEMTGLSGWEIRYRNAIRPGQSLPNGQIADEGTAMAECLEAVKTAFDEAEANPDVYVGIACAMKNAGIGVGLKDTGRCKLFVTDGKVHIRSSAGPIGQGLQTVFVQILCEVTGLVPGDCVVENPDTKYTPDAGTTTASRQTVFTGEATRQAALQLKKELDKGKSLDELEGASYLGEFDYATDPIGSDKKNPVSHIAYGYGTQLVIIDREGKLVKVIAAHDVGRAINPLSAEGQVEGGVVMSLGYGLTEDFPLKEGIPQAKLGSLGLLRSNQVPPIEVHLIEKNKAETAFGAKGVGEIVAVMAAPAVQNAYFKKDGIFRSKYPLENTFYKKAK